MGRKVVLVGHGVVERQVRGPQRFDGEAAQLSVKLRRYRCRECRAVVAVGPAGLLRRRWYGAGAIAVAFSMRAGGAASAQIRARISPSQQVGASAAERWLTLERWVDAARRGALFEVSGLEAVDQRSVAEHVTLALAGRAGRQLGEDLAAAAFRGAAIAR